MKYRFFHIPALDPGAEAEALNRFLSERRILSVERQFVLDGQNSFWALSIAYADTESAPGSPDGANPGRRPRVDYREVLNERDFTAYATLRTLRKELAEREGVPAYALFTNDQLAAMVQRKVRTAEDLAAVDGVGKARIERYGAAFLAVLTERAAAESAEGGDAPGTD